jgi:NAD(P)H-dependent FMN reductase
MKVLVITQSSGNGLNRKLAETIKATVVKNATRPTEVAILNANAINTEVLSQYQFQIWVVPEWNGTFPFTFKELIDNSGYPSKLAGTYVLLVGTSETTFGNVMGISHLQYVLQLIGAHPTPKTISIPSLSKVIEERDERLEKAIIDFIK